MNYEIEYNDFFEFLELKNIVASKKRVLANNKASLYSYFNQFYKLVFAFILFYVSYCISYGDVFESIFYIFSIFSLALILAFLILFLSFIIQYNRIREGRSGKMTFTEKGIVDYSDKGYICGFAWDKVQLVIVGKKSTVVFSKYPFCLFVNTKDNKVLLEKVKKYNKEVEIVYRKK